MPPCIDVPPRSARLLQVLLIEDQPADRTLTEEAFQPCLYLAHLHVLQNPCDTLMWLRSQGSLPDVILLDLNMSGCDGLTLLDGIRSDLTFHAVRIVVLAHSSDAQDDSCLPGSAPTSSNLGQVQLTRRDSLVTGHRVP